MSVADESSGDQKCPVCGSPFMEFKRVRQGITVEGGKTCVKQDMGNKMVEVYLHG